jgi:hypothetical protein
VRVKEAFCSTELMAKMINIDSFYRIYGGTSFLDLLTLAMSIPDMRGQGQPACLITGRKNEERNHNSYMCTCNVSCVHNVVYG